MMPKTPQFVALLTFLPEEKGGRKTPAMSGFRAAIKFPFGGEWFMAGQNYVDADNAFPGDRLKAEVTLFDPEKIIHKLYEGLDFDFFESGHLIGHGLITRILNPGSSTDDN